jgi:quercetin dioxygenase-like cupin family protein
MAKSNIPPEWVIFPKGVKIVNQYFIGVAWLEMLVPDDSTFNCPIGNVMFEPGTRNNWHKHPGGQILLVTGGKGYSQEEGRPVQVLHEGDVVKVPPNVKHWHGAAPDSWFTHIAVMPHSEKGDAEWFGPVTDEEYSAIGPGLETLNEGNYT